MINKQINNKNLKIILWNANGLKQKEPELLNFLLDNQIDAALITETHYTNNSKHFFPGYNVYSTNHPDGTSHAGSAILISSSIQHYALPCFQFPSIQATNVSISINHIPIIISAVYCPPRPSISQLLLNQFLSSLGRTFIAGGDFNAKHLLWGSRVENPRGRIFFNSIQMNKLSVISPWSNLLANSSKQTT